MRAAATSAVTLDWGAAFVLLEWPARLTETEQFSIFTVSLAMPTVTASAPLSLRI